MGDFFFQTHHEKLEKMGVCVIHSRREGSKCTCLPVKLVGVTD